MNHLEAQAGINPPRGMHMASLKQVPEHEHIRIMEVFGGKGTFAPGFYLVDNRYAKHGVPLAGPFASSMDAYNGWIRWHGASLSYLPHLRPAYMGYGSILYQPSVLVNAGVIQFGEHSRVDSFCKLEGGEGLVIGAHVHVASFAHIGIGGGLTILEEGSSFASGSKIISGSNMPDAPSMSATAPASQQRTEKKVTRICKNAAILTNAVVMPGVTVGEGARVAAGAVVTKDVEPFTLVAGVPAVVKHFRRYDRVAVSVDRTTRLDQ